MFHGTHIPLRNWFLVLALLWGAKSSSSANQMSRDLGMRRATVSSMIRRIQAAIAADPDQELLLRSIVNSKDSHLGDKIDPLEKSERLNTGVA